MSEYNEDVKDIAYRIDRSGAHTTTSRRKVKFVAVTDRDADMVGDTDDYVFVSKETKLLRYVSEASCTGNDNQPSVDNINKLVGKKVRVLWGDPLEIKGTLIATLEGQLMDGYGSNWDNGDRWWVVELSDKTQVFIPEEWTFLMEEIE